jgi:hypothetical protein
MPIPRKTAVSYGNTCVQAFNGSLLNGFSAPDSFGL